LLPHKSKYVVIIFKN